MTPKFIQLINDNSIKVHRVVQETKEYIVVEEKGYPDVIFTYKVFKTAIVFIELEETHDNTIQVS
jgi:hypothetical protein